MPQVEGISLEELQENLDKLTTAGHMMFCSGRYQAVLDAFRQLNDFLREMEPDHKLSKNEVTQMYSYYQDIAKATKEYLEGKTPDSQKSWHGKLRFKAATDLCKLAEQGLEALDKETSAEKSVTQVLTDAQMAKLDPSTQQVEHVTVTAETMAGNSSSRFKVKNGDELVGFFTPEIQNESEYGKYRNFKKANKGLYNALENKYKGFELLTTRAKVDGADVDTDLVLGLAAKFKGMNSIEQDALKKNFQEIYSEAMFKTVPQDSKLSKDSLSKQFAAEADALLADPLFQNLFMHTLKEMNITERSLRGGSDIAGTVRGNQVARQNVAMSRVADMLGVSERIARSKMAVAMIDGVPTKGVLMDKAVGLDALSSADGKIIDRPFVYSPESIQAVGELGVLDLICGNVDRHFGNMFYSFKEVDTPQGKIQMLTGVQGIDNDASFGTVDIGVDKVHYMSDRMAKAVMALDHDTFVANLNGLLTPEQIQKSWGRIENLQAKLIDRKVIPLKDDEWAKMFTTPEGIFQPSGRDVKKFRSASDNAQHINNGILDLKTANNISFNEVGDMDDKKRQFISQEKHKTLQDVNDAVERISHRNISSGLKGQLIQNARAKADARAKTKWDEWLEPVMKEREKVQAYLAEKQKEVDAHKAQFLEQKYAELDREQGLEVNAMAADIVEQHNYDLVHNRTTLKVFEQSMDRFRPKTFGNDKKFEAMQEQLHNLNKLMDDLSDDKEPLSRKTQAKLLQQYDATLKAMNDYISHGIGIGPGASERKKTLIDMRKVLEKDKRAVENQEFSIGKTVEELMKESRSRLVIVDPKQLETAAGLSNVRLHIPGKGYFTEDFSLQHPLEQTQKLREQLLTEKADVLTEEEKAFFSAKSSSAYVSKRYVPGIERVTEYALTDGDRFLKLDAAEKTKELRELIKRCGMKEEQADRMIAHPEFMQEFEKFINETGTLSRAYGNFTDLGSISDGHNITDRNVAMSVMAGQLGLGHVLAESSKVKLEIGGETKYGVLMKEAKGIDLRNLSKNHPEMKDIQEIAYTEECLRQVNDMMFLDYISGNPDRNTYNLFYDFERTEDGKVKITDGKAVMTGVMGIDNDISFGMIPPGPGERPPITNCKYISRDTYDRIMSMTKEDMESSFRGLLAPSEIDCAWERTQYLKQVLTDKTLGIQVLEKDEFSKVAKNPYDLVKNPAGHVMQNTPSSIANAGDFLKYKEEEFGAKDVVSYAVKQKKEKEAAEKAAKEKAEKEAAEKAAKEKAEKEKAEKEAAEKEAKEKAEKEKAEREKAEKEKAEKEKTDKEDKKAPKQPWQAGSLSPERKKELQARKAAFKTNPDIGQRDLTSKAPAPTAGKEKGMGMGSKTN